MQAPSERPTACRLLPPPWPPCSVLWHSLVNPFNLILLGLSAASWLFSDPATCAIMLLMVAASTTLRFQQVGRRPRRWPQRLPPGHLPLRAAWPGNAAWQSPGHSRMCLVGPPTSLPHFPHSCRGVLHACRKCGRWWRLPSWRAQCRSWRRFCAGMTLAWQVNARLLLVPTPAVLQSEGRDYRSPAPPGSSDSP